MRKRSFVALLVIGATILGATVLREPIASAAQGVSATIVGPLDAQGNVEVHEQGTASVHVENEDRAGSVKVHEQGGCRFAMSRARRDRSSTSSSWPSARSRLLKT